MMQLTLSLLMAKDQTCSAPGMVLVRDFPFADDYVEMQANVGGTFHEIADWRNLDGSSAFRT
jgi:hypothetical protein